MIMCPLKSGQSAFKCREEVCAWWDKVASRCVVAVIALNLEAVINQLDKGVERY